MVNVTELVSHLISRKRSVDVLFIIAELRYVRNYEIVDILHLRSQNVSQIFSELLDLGLISKGDIGGHNVYGLTNNGIKVVDALKDYYGSNGK